VWGNGVKKLRVQHAAGQSWLLNLAQRFDLKVSRCRIRITYTSATHYFEDPFHSRPQSNTLSFAAWGA
jgi:hypothetical protein